MNKKILSLYKSVVGYCCVEGNEPISINSIKSISNFKDELLKIVSAHEYFCDYIFADLFEKHVSLLKVNYDKREEKMPKSEDLEKFLDEIRFAFDFHKTNYFLLIPLAGSKLREDIKIGNLYFLSYTDNEEEVLNKVYKVTKTNEKKLFESLGHFKRAKLPQFFKNNLLIIKIEHNASFADYYSSFIAQNIINILNLVANAQEFEVYNYDIKINSIKHVALLFNDKVNSKYVITPKPLSNILECRLNLDFIFEFKYKKIIKELIKDFLFEENQDELFARYLNALILYSRALEQHKKFKDNSLALLLYITAAESLITEGKQEKRLRLSIVLPRIIKIPKKDIKRTSDMIRKLYLWRNDFVHAGKILDRRYSNDELEEFQKNVAKLIMNFKNIKSILNCKNNVERIKQWQAYVREIFEKVVF